MTRYLVDVLDELLAQPLTLPAGFRFIEAGPLWYGPADGDHATRTMVVDDEGADRSLEGRKIKPWFETDQVTGEVRVRLRELVD